MLERAFLKRKDNGAEVHFLFNPKEFSVEKSNQFAEVNIGHQVIVSVLNILDSFLTHL